APSPSDKSPSYQLGHPWLPSPLRPDGASTDSSYARPSIASPYQGPVSPWPPCHTVYLVSSNSQEYCKILRRLKRSLLVIWERGPRASVRFCAIRKLSLKKTRPEGAARPPGPGLATTTRAAWV